MKKLCLISFDAVGSDEVPNLLMYPNFSRLAGSGRVFTDLKTVFVSNTNPIHASVATGCVPAEHGLISNTKVQPEKRHPDWNFDSRLLKKQTLWQFAAERGLRTAAILWPVTGYAKGIRWNIPESIAPEGESQVITNMKTGSILIQLRCVLKYRGLMDGVRQPALDRFSTACACDILRRHQPGLTLLHFTAYDSICHEFGRKAPETMAMLKELDDNLGKVMAAAGDDTTFIIFSDHSQLNVHTAYDPNTLVGDPARGYFQNADGSSFFLPGTMSAEEIAALKQQVLAYEGTNRELTDAEMAESGYAGKAAFGIAAKPGWYFHSGAAEKATHGYPTDYENYRVFMALNRPWPDLETNSILEVNKAAKRIISEL